MVTETFHGVRVFQDANEPVIAQPVSTSVIGMLMAVDPTDLPSGVAVNTPVAIRNPSDAADLPAAVKEELDTVWDNGGGQVILVVVDEGADAAELATNATGDATAKTGVHAFKKAVTLGLSKPKLLCLPGVAKAAASGTADPVVAEAIVVANSLKAQLYVDAPNTTLAEAKSAATLIGAEKRVCISDPFVLKSVGGTPTAKSSSTLFAAVQSSLDRTRSVAWPATNVLARGIVGVNRPTDY
ncbi:MAG: hypothetical protein NXI30_29025, partial [bacterium]|nr:hypothetical protein [bacterium]